jgi:hypothetical protein
MTGFSMGRSIGAGASGAGGGSTGLATIGATGIGFGSSTRANWRTGGGGAGRRGATTGTGGGNFTVAGNTNTILDGALGADGSSDARIGTTITTTTAIACSATLSHRPVVHRPCGRVLNRVSSNRIDMCRTELK